VLSDVGAERRSQPVPIYRETHKASNNLPQGSRHLDTTASCGLFDDQNTVNFKDDSLFLETSINWQLSIKYSFSTSKRRARRAWAYEPM